MKEILINSEVGGWFGITANNIREQFGSVIDGEDIKLVVDCPGGDCFEGISIYNFIRDYARNHSGTITTYIQGMAASAASWIALAANSIDKRHKIVCEDNSVFMIHNSWGVAVGDYREMEKSADFTKRIDALIKSMLAKRSQKTEKEIGKLMDAETWYFGKEILESGFCDEIMEATTENSDSKDKYMDCARSSFIDCKNKIEENVKKEPKKYKDSFDKSFESFNKCTKSEFSDSNKTSEKKSEQKEVTVMNKQELMAQNKALYDEVYNEASVAAVEKERQRVSDLLSKFEKAGNASAALDFIKNGKSVSDSEVVDSLIETSVKSRAIENRKADEPPAFIPSTKKEVEDEATREFKAAFGL